MEPQQRDWNLGKDPNPSLLCTDFITLVPSTCPAAKKEPGTWHLLHDVFTEFPFMFWKKPQNACKVLESQTRRKSLSSKLHSCCVTICCRKEVSLYPWSLTASTTADKSIYHCSFVSGTIKLLFSLGSLLSIFSQYDSEQIVQGPCSANILVHLLYWFNTTSNSAPLSFLLTLPTWDGGEKKEG